MVMSKPLLFIVESEPAILELYRQLFLEEGYKVRGFSQKVSSKEVKLVKLFQPDLF